MLLLSLFSCLWALALVQAHPKLGHVHLHRALLNGQAQKPNDVLDLGTQTATTSTAGHKNTGTIVSSLETSGNPSVQPYATTKITKPTSTVDLNPHPAIKLVVQPTTAPKVVDVFDAPISTGRQAAVIGSRSDHPVPKKGITNQNGPIGTNKFYAGFFLGDQSNAVWTYPYSLSWSKGIGNAKSWGLSVSHSRADQRIYGPDPAANPVEYYINPIGVQSIIFSAKELGPSMSLTTSSLTAWSANVNLLLSSGSAPAITVPLVHGMGYVTAIYNGVTPYIDSSVYFTKLIPLPSPKPGVTKYRVVLADARVWLIYAIANNGTGLALKLSSTTRIKAPGAFFGKIQVAKNLVGDPVNEKTYDQCSGSYAISTTVSGSVDGSHGSYNLNFKKVGTGPLLMFALPHHLETIDLSKGLTKTAIQLWTPTKGIATGIIGDSWTLIENNLPTTIGFAPWDVTTGSTKSIPASAKKAINAAGASELSQDIDAQSNLDSMYFSGKALSKFATAIYAIHDLSGNVSLANAGLAKLKSSFARFATNKQKFPLTYESSWGGVVSTAGYVTGDPNSDFGNTWYNDHHFHWAYFIHTASIIGYLDPTWIPANKDWVNTLVRDCANPSSKDPLFPVSRSFDWYHGHSWAKGLFDSADGKDEESSSEDVLLAYAIKMWGKTIKDSAMEARGNLMLAVLKRSLHNYFLLESSNKNHPANFILNKVTGILFENKVDHATYFGLNTEYIQGIHMIPIVPISAYTRNKNFITEEWARYFDNGRVDQVQGGWRGILYSNYALINAKAAWKFFSQAAFKPEWLDGGASLTWYLALSAGLGGAN